MRINVDDFHKGLYNYFLCQASWCGTFDIEVQFKLDAYIIS